MSDRLWSGIALLLLGLCLLLERRLLAGPESLWALLFWLLVLAGALAAGALFLTSLPLPLPVLRPSSPPRVWSHFLGWAAGLATLCALISARAVTQDEGAAQWWWLAGMAIPPLALTGAGWRCIVEHFRAIDVPGWRREAAICLGVLGTSLVVRLPDLTASPPFVHGDEASCGLYGRLFNAGHTPLLSISWYDLPMLSYATAGLALRLFGDNLVGLRMSNVLLGSAGVLLIYLLGKEWFGRRTGFLAAALLAVGFLHADLSRNGIHYMQGPTLITLNLYLLTRWLTRGSSLAALLAGYSFSVDLQVYWSARVAIVPTVVLLLYVVVQQWGVVRPRWQEMGWFALALVVSIIPLLALFTTDPVAFNSHQGSVSILSRTPDMTGHLISVYGTSSLAQILPQQAWRTVTTFVVRGSASVQIGWSGPFFDWLTAALLAPAIAFALLNWRRWPFAVCLAWFAAVVGAGALTVDPPWWPRLAALLPAVALLVGALLDTVWTGLEHWSAFRLLPAVGITCLVAAIAFTNLQILYGDYPAQQRQGATMAVTLVGNFLLGRPDASHTTLLSDGSFALDHETIRFLAPHSGGCTILPGQAWSTCPTLGRTRVFVLLAGALGNLTRLRQDYPQGKTVEVGRYNFGTSRILAYFLPRRQRVTASEVSLTFVRGHWLWPVRAGPDRRGGSSRAGGR